MDAVTATATMTAQEFLALEPPERRSLRRELVNGEIVVNEPTRRHSGAQGYIHGSLWQWARAAPGRGWASVPLDVQFGELSVLCPDVVWYREGRVPELDDPPPYRVPDLVVEVRSPSTWRYDIGSKKAIYERHGATELWLVDTAAAVVLVFRRSSPATTVFDVSLELTSVDALTSPLLPGFALPVGEIFSD